MSRNQKLALPPGEVSGVIEEIYKKLSQSKHKITGFGLSNGYLGLSVFYCLYGWHTGNKFCLEESAILFDQAIELINMRPINYAPGFTDLGVVSHYLIECGVVGYQADQFLDEVDHFLIQQMRQRIKQMDFGGFSQGVIGHGLYFLERARFNPHRFTPVVQELIQGLLNFCVTTGQAAHWYADKIFRMTLWNGQAAIVLFLAVAAERGFIEKQVVSSILGKAIHYISYQVTTQPQTSTLLSFPMGDLGIGYAMLRAGQVFENKTWRDCGLDLLGKRAGFCLANADTLQSAGILTGAAGAALAFDKIYELTENALFSAAADLCFSVLLPLYYQGCDDGTLADRDSGLCFGTGIAGVGAALIRSVHRCEPGFDHLVWLI